MRAHRMIHLHLIGLICVLVSSSAWGAGDEDARLEAWERQSGLAPADVDFLRERRELGFSRPRANEQANQLLQVLHRETITDQGVALVISSIDERWKDDARLTTPGGGFTNSISWVFVEAIHHPVAGPVTLGVFDRWVQTWYLPSARVPRKKGGESAHDRDGVVLRELLLADSFSDHTYEQLWPSSSSGNLMVNPPSTTQEMGNYVAPLIGRLHSRHLTASQMQDLVTKILRSMQSSEGQFVKEILPLLIAAPRITPQQMQAVGDWLLAQMEAEGRMSFPSSDEPMRLLSGTHMPEWGPSQVPNSSGWTRSSLGHWQKWWTSHRATIGSDLNVRAKYRYVSGVIEFEPGRPQIRILSDAVAQERRGVLIRHQAPIYHEWVLVRGADSIERVDSVSPEVQKELVAVQSGQFGGWRSTYASEVRALIKGDVDRLRSISRDEAWFPVKDTRQKQLKRLFVRTVLDAGNDEKDLKVDTLDFWEARLIRTALRGEMWALEHTLSDGSIHYVPPYSDKFRLKDLETCQTPGLQARVVELQKSVTPRVAAEAGVLLARWGVPPDRDCMLRLLGSGDVVVADRAASALASSGSIEGILHHIDRAKKEGPASPAYQILEKLSGEVKLSAELRRQAAVLVIERLLPEAEDAGHPALPQCLLAQHWSGQDFGYRAGGEAETNAQALVRYHDWARGKSVSTRPGGALATASRPARSRNDPKFAEQISLLINQLDSPSLRVRDKALEQLNELGSDAVPFLEAALVSPERLSYEQQSRMGVILKGGQADLLERASRLDPEVIELLRRFRAGLPERRREDYKASRALSKAIEKEQLTDADNALIVSSLCIQSSKEESQKGTGASKLGGILGIALTRSCAGPRTLAAVEPWVKRWCERGIKLTDEERKANPAVWNWGILLRLLVMDALSGETFDTLWPSFIAKARTGPSRDGMSEQAQELLVVALCHSRWVTPERMSDLVAATLQLHESGVSADYPERDPLRFMIVSPKTTPSQLRAIGDSIIGHMKLRRGSDGRLDDELARLLSGVAMCRTGDSTLNMPGAEPEKIIASRWQEWWKTHRDQMGSDIASRPKYRYVSVEMDLRKDGPTVRVLSDVIVRERQAQMIRWPDVAAAEWVAVMGPGYVQEYLPSEPWPEEVFAQIAAVQTARIDSQLTPPWNVQTRFLGDTNRPYPFLLNRVAPPATESARRVRLQTILPTAGPAADASVTSVDFWEERMIRPAMRCERCWRDSRGVRDRIPRGALYPMEALQSCRTPGLESRLAALQKDPSAPVASGAGLVLARWGISPDRERMLALMSNGDRWAAERAALALTAAGSFEGIAYLVDRAATEGKSGGAYRMLGNMVDEHQQALRPVSDTLKLTREQRRGGAVLVIQGLLPRKETRERTAVAECLLAQAWSGQDFGYRAGGDPGENSAALEAYHRWAAENAGATQPASRPEE